MRLSVVIPLGPDEPEWPPLFNQLRWLPHDSEVILCGFGQNQRPTQLNTLPPKLARLHWHWNSDSKGRAAQMNRGARQASGDYLWFVHADSLLQRETVEALVQAINQTPKQLYYFDLYFYDKHTWLLHINEWGARVRSRLLGAPFGDQGLCLSRGQFFQLGCYPEWAPYGEDHLLVWKARQADIKLQPCNRALATSARKYQHRGWLKLTLSYQKLWLQQAWPEFLRLIRKTR